MLVAATALLLLSPQTSFLLSDNTKPATSTSVTLEELTYFTQLSSAQRKEFLKTHSQWRTSTLVLTLILKSNALLSDRKTASQARVLADAANALADELSDPTLLAETQYHLALLHFHLRNHPLARKYYLEVLPYYRSHDNLPYQQDVLLSLGGIAALDGDPQTALSYYGQAATDHPRADPDRRAAAYSMCAEIQYRSLKKLTEAIQSYRQAIDIWATRPRTPINRFSICTAYCDLAQALTTQGKPKEAYGALQPALSIAATAKSAALTIMVSNAAGNVHVALSDYDRAIDYYTTAIDVYREGRWKGELDSLGVEMRTYLSMSLLHREFLESLTGLAVWAGRVKRFREARNACQLALDDIGSSGEAPARALFLQQLAFIYRQQGNIAEAEKCQKDAVATLGSYPEQQRRLVSSLLIDREIVEGRLPPEVRANSLLAIPDAHNDAGAAPIANSMRGIEPKKLISLARTARLEYQNPSLACDLLLAVLDRPQTNAQPALLLEVLDELTWASFDRGDARLAAFYADRSYQNFQRFRGENKDLVDELRKEALHNLPQLTVLAPEGRDVTSSYYRVARLLTAPRVIYASVIAEPGLATPQLVDALLSNQMHMTTKNRFDIDRSLYNARLLKAANQSVEAEFAVNTNVSQVVLTHAAELCLEGAALKSLSDSERLIIGARVELELGETRQYLGLEESAAASFWKASTLFEDAAHRRLNAQQLDSVRRGRVTALIRTVGSSRSGAEKERAAEQILRIEKETKDPEFRVELHRALLSAPKVLERVGPDAETLVANVLKHATSESERTRLRLTWLTRRFEEGAAKKPETESVPMGVTLLRECQAAEAWELVEEVAEQLATLYIRQRRYDSAEEMIRARQRAASARGSTAAVADADVQLAELAQKQKHWNKALDHFEAAIRAYNENVPLEELRLANALSELAYLKLEMVTGGILRSSKVKNTAALLKELQTLQERALRIHHKQGRQRSVALDLYFIAQLEAANDLRAALLHSKQSVEIVRQLQTHAPVADNLLSLAWKAKFLFAQLLMYPHSDSPESSEPPDLRRLLDLLQEAVTDLERLDDRNDEQTTGYFDDWGVRHVYERLIEVMASLGDLNPKGGWSEKSLSVAERFRSRSLNSTLRHTQLALRSPSGGKALSQYRNDLRRLRDVEAQISAETEKPESMRRLNVLTALENESRLISASLASQRKRLDSALGVESSSTTQAELARSLNLIAGSSNDTLLLEYFLGARHSYLWSVRNGIAEVHSLPDRDTIGPAITEYYRFLAKASSHQEASDYQLGHELYSVLVDRHTLNIREDTRVWIVPDGELCLIPFEALVTRMDSARLAPTRYLLHECKSIQYVPSIATRAHLVDKAQGHMVSDLRLLAFSQSNFEGLQDPLTELPLKPLPHATEEVKAISGLFKSPSVFCDSACNREEFERCITGKYDVLHVASHTRLLGYPLELGAIVLGSARGSRKDGVVRYRDLIAAGPLNFKLVVLSGCETAYSRLSESEGSLGLGRAFTANGVPTVVSSLWRVDDKATSILMLEFYRAWLNGKTAPEAMLLARRKLVSLGESSHSSTPRGIEEGEDMSVGRRHPHYWAGFVVYGL